MKPLLVALLMTGASAASAQAPAVVGSWHGTSICVDKVRFPACHDEEIIYDVEPRPGTTDSVSVRGDRVVNGAREFMGELSFARRSDGVWVADLPAGRAPDRWELSVDGHAMTGRLVSLPDGRLVRRVALQRMTTPALAPSPNHESVSVGDHRLDVVRAGTGAPAVVFETGLGDSLDTWATFVPAVGNYTTALAYSRAGFGRSESGSSDHSARAEVTDLHVLLQRLGVTGPVVLVARSYGGLLARLYTSLYPSEVAGLVLVDGVHEQQVRRWGELDPRYPEQFRVFFDSVLATLPPGPPAAEMRETVRIQAAGTVEGLRPLPDIPIAVITSMKSDTAAATVNGTPRGHDAWRAMHDEWFLRSSNGEHIATTRSGHDIQATEPQLVLDAIRFVFDRTHAPPTTIR